MRRKLSLGVLMLLVMASPGLQAVGLGEPQVASSLSEPLRARIELNDLDGLDPRQLRVSLAGAAAFEQAGLERRALVEGISLALSRDSGQSVVTLSSEQPVNEPYLDLLLSLAWPGGELQRQVTLLFDPPGYATIPALVGANAPTLASRDAERPAPLRAESLSRAGAQPQSLRVASGDTLWGLANRVRQGSEASIEQAMLALLQTNPDAFSRDNINGLRSGVALDVPSREMLSAYSREEARRQVEAQHQAWRSGSVGSAESDASAESVAQAETGPAEAPRQRLTLLSDAELAEEQQGESLPSDTVSAAGQDGTDDSETSASPEPAVAAQERTRLDELEANWQSSQEGLAQVREERNRLEGEIASLRREMAELREMLATPSVAEPADSAVSNRASAVVSQPAVAIQPATESAVPGLWQRGGGWVNDHLLMLGGAAVALLLALLVGLRLRDRARRDEDTTLSFPQGMAAGGRFQSSASTAADTPAPVVAPVLERAPQAEAINEADIFIAYGRYEQARELLEESLESEPERDDLRLKLLAVLVELGDRPAAEREAHRLESLSDPDDYLEMQRLLARLGNAPTELAEATTAPAAHAEPEARVEPKTGVDARPAPEVSAVSPLSSADDALGTSWHVSEVALDADVPGHDEPGPAEPRVESALEITETKAADAPEVAGAQAVAADVTDERIIDYEPPRLDPTPSWRQDDLRQPSVEYPGPLDDPMRNVRQDVSADEPLGAPEWDVEEVAFEPLNLDNEKPATYADSRILEESGAERRGF